MNKAIFLDRDGVINKERKDYVKNINELEIFENVSWCIKQLKKNDYLVIVITNQSAVNRGLMDIQSINEIHSEIQNYLSKFNTKIDAFYFCPHRPDEGCICRKPKSGLIFQAANDFDINLKSSWMIGDNESDVISGKNTGCHTIKLNHQEELVSSVNRILNF